MNDIQIQPGKKFRSIAINPHHQRLVISRVHDVVSKHCEIEKERVKQRRRKREIVQARQLCMYFSHKFTKASLKNIGEYYGGFDHTTVIHSCSTVENLMDTEEDYKALADKIEQELFHILLYEHLVVTRQEYIEELSYFPEGLKEILDVINLDYMASHDPRETKEQLAQYDISLGSAMFYHSKVSLEEFANAMKTPYIRSSFIMYALEQMFPDTYESITHMELRGPICEDKGRHWMRLYREFIGMI